MDLHVFLDNVSHLSALCILTALSGSLSASETALFALTRQQLNHFKQSRRGAMHMVLRLREEPRALLSTVLLANIAVNILLYSMLAITADRLGSGSPLWTAVFGATGFVLVLFAAEIMPKLVAFALSERLAPIVALPIRALEIVTTPLRWFLETLLVEPLTRLFSGTEDTDSGIRAEELQQLVNICQKEGLIDERENTILHQLMELADLHVSALMVPRVDLVAFDLADDRRQLLELIKSSRLMRIPIYEGDIDHIRGIIHAKEFLLNPDRSVAELIQPVHFIPEQASVEALLAHFRTTGSQLAMVVDEYGGLAGAIALEDIVEAIVGQLYDPDETAAPPRLQRLSDTAYLLDAGLDVDDFRRAFDLPIQERRINTVGGLIADELDRVPRRGDQVTIGHARLTVVAMKDHRILRVRLTLERPVPDNPDLSILLDSQPHGDPPRTGAGGQE